ncbi:MAG: murein biosynthesis integral membrane protein MurJ [Phycisphaerae bacterium]
MSSAKLIALCTLLSRVTGLVRDMLVMHAFGQKWVADAFWYAFQFPNLFRRLFGEGALAAVFVPVFTRTLEREGRPAAWKLLARTLCLLTLTLVAIVIVIELIVLAIWMLAPGATVEVEQSRGLLLVLTATMLPFMISICVLALFSSILNCVGSFGPAALASIVLNVLMIAALLAAPWLAGESAAARVQLVAWSVVIAGVLQILIILPAMRSVGIELGWTFSPRDPQVRELLLKLGPALLGQGILLISTFLDTQLCVALTAVGDATHARVFGVSLAYPLQEGALSAVNAAARLYQFPLGVLVISLATAALPAFSRLAARGDWPAWMVEVRQMFRLALFEGLLVGAMMIVLADAIIRLLFEHGAFDAAATQRSAAVLSWYGAGMWAFCAQHIVLRGFYSMGDVTTPLRISLVAVPVNFALSAALVWVDGVRESAFAISSAVTAGGAVIAGLWLLARAHRVAFADAATLGAMARMLIAAIAAAAGVWWFRGWWLTAIGGDSMGLLARCVDTFGGLGLGMAMFLGIAAMLGLPESRMLLAVFARRSPRANGG